MRVFAGPNGSGKSAVYNLVRKHYRIGHYLNADEIEHDLSNKGFLNLDDFGIQLGQNKYLDYLGKSAFTQKSKESGLGINLRLQENVLVCTVGKSNSYEAAFIAEMLRWEYLSMAETFSFETVMSHPSKIDVFERANEFGYKSYLYFVCTQDPAINKERIQNRVLKGGHPVPEIKVEERYYRSLEILATVANYAHRSYLFDNSGEETLLIAELTPEKKIILHNELIPAWVERYFLKELK